MDGRRVGTTPATFKGQFPGLRRIELVKDQYARATRVVDTRPAPPVLIFPFDFPWDLVASLFQNRDTRLTWRLEPVSVGPAKGPGAKGILELTRRARELGQRRVE